MIISGTRTGALQTVPFDDVWPWLYTRLPRKTKKAYHKPVWQVRPKEWKRLRRMGLIDPRTGR